MMHKLTALILALIIGSPVCWCGWMHQQASAPVKSCCHAKKAGEQKHSSDRENKDCPCSQAPKARDLASSKTSVPQIKVTSLDWVTPHSSYVCLATLVYDTTKRLAALDHAPPRSSTRPLFLTQCTWLI